MAFKLNDEAKIKYKQITDIQFELYYLFCVLGMLGKKTLEITSKQDFVSYVPDAYNNARYDELVLMLLNTEIIGRPIDKQNRLEIKQLADEILSADQADETKLTSRGLDLLNGYCEAGYQIALRENLSPMNKRLFYKYYYLTIDKLVRSYLLSE